MLDFDNTVEGSTQFHFIYCNDFHQASVATCITCACIISLGNYLQIKSAVLKILGSSLTWLSRYITADAISLHLTTKHMVISS